MDLLSDTPEVDEESAVTGELLLAQPTKRTRHNIKLPDNARVKVIEFIRFPPSYQQLF